MALPTAPPGFDGIMTAAGLPDGRVQIVLVDAGTSVASVEAVPLHVSEAVLTLLLAAQMAQVNSGIPLSETGQVLTLSPTKIALANDQTPGHKALIFRFGEAAIGFRIPDEMTRQIGQLMMAVTADQKEKN
jgi:hypothetical protein